MSGSVQQVRQSRSRAQLNTLFGRTLAFTIRYRCGTSVKTERVKIFVDVKGALKLQP